MKHLKKLWVQVIIGLILGIIAGVVLKEKADSFKILGKIFIQLIKMAIVPLIFFALLSGVTSISEGQDFKSLSIKGFASYLSTAVFAVIIGLVVGTVLKPGVGVDL